MPDLSLISRATRWPSSLAFRASVEPYTYRQLLDDSADLAHRLLKGTRDLTEARIAVLAEAGADFATAQWGIWRAGGIMLPLCMSATEPEWEYTLTDSDTSTVVTSANMRPRIESLCQRLELPIVCVEGAGPAASTLEALPSIDVERRAMILYTSGTTSKPKGVVTTHANIQAQIESLVTAWEWSDSDRIPLFLPLHHIHGVINVMSCALWSGATIEPFSKLDVSNVFARVRADAYTVFMAVPTIYVKMIEALRAAPTLERDTTIAGFQRMRLMVSGSAALPARVHDEWFELTGQKLLERYGMTEIGMALSNPLHGERIPGTVGQPLPGVAVRLKSEAGKIVSDEGTPGEIQVRGPGVFREYWNRPAVTTESFDEGWFRTGDVALVDQGYYRILGRQSVDIIKSGGYKLSALEIEAVLLEHPHIRECAVVGVDDATWGEAVSAAIVVNSDGTLDIESLREWCRDRLSVYKIPKRLLVVEQLPRNAMGKVTKPEVRRLFEST